MWAVDDIDHTKTKAMSLQKNGVCERFDSMKRC